MSDSDSFLFELDDDLSDENFNGAKRSICSRCERPVLVCLCSHLPVSPIHLNHTSVIIFQHPNEIKRPLGTVQILSKCLDSSSLNIVRARQFPQKYHENLYADPNTYLLFPNANAILLDDLIEDNKHYNIIALDGTWNEAMGIYHRHSELQRLKTCFVKIDQKSAFVIRTQPTKETASTLETIAYALRCTEKDSPDLYERIVRPLQRMVELQLNLGAVVHEAKLSLIKNGQTRRQYSKKHERWLMSLQH
jgi:DTW domain-containing protein YfiP